MHTFKGRNKDEEEMEVVEPPPPPPPPLGLIEGECVITDGQRYTLSTTPFARDHRILTDDNDDDDDHLFPMSSDEDDDVSFSVPIHITFRSPTPTPTKDGASKKQLGNCSTQDAAQLGLDGLQKKRARDEADTTPPNAAKKCKLAAVELGFDTEVEEEEEEVIHLSSDDDVVMEKQVVFDRVSKHETCGKGDEIECVSHLEATEVMGEEVEELKEKQVLFDRVSNQETCGKGDGSVTKCLIELLTVLGETSLGKGKEAEEVDFLETAIRKGYTFPNPRFL